jgi:hypothetical protein
MAIQLRPLTTKNAYMALAQAAELLRKYLDDPTQPLASETRSLLGQVVESYDGAPEPQEAPSGEPSMLPAPSKCRSCQAPIVWSRTLSNNKTMPIDAVTDPAGRFVVARVDQDENGKQTPIVRSLGRDEDWHGARFTSHFATCPNSDQHRSSR